MKHYRGFAICLKEDKSGTFFKRKKMKEVFCNVRVGADNFVEAQEMLCDKMQMHKMSVAFIFPYTEEDLNDARRADFE